MTAPTRAKQRAKVATLAAQDVPNREIARRTGIPESTVRRWRTTAPQAAAPPGAPPSAPSGGPDDAARGAPADAPETRNGAPHDAHAAHPAAPDSAPPHAERAFAFALDDTNKSHLTLLAEAGHDPQTAITTALNLLANAYGYAWDYGLAPRGTAPQLRVQIRGDSPPPWPANTSDGSTQPGTEARGVR